MLGLDNHPRANRVSPLHCSCPRPHSLPHLLHFSLQAKFTFSHSLHVQSPGLQKQKLNSHPREKSNSHLAANPPVLGVGGTMASASPWGRARCRCTAVSSGVEVLVQVYRCVILFSGIQMYMQVYSRVSQICQIALYPTLELGYYVVIGGISINGQNGSSQNGKFDAPHGCSVGF